jgi:ribonuclease P protein component
LNYSLSSSDFLQSIIKSRSLNLEDLSFKYKKSSKPRLGLAVSKNYGNSVKRNLFKRRCRNVFKIVVVDNNINYSVIVFPKNKNISYLNIKKSFSSFYDKVSN